MKKRWTQLELAKISGVPQCTISQLERGNRKYPTYETIRKIAKALDLTLEEIYLLQDHKEKGAVKEEEGKAPAFL